MQLRTELAPQHTCFAPIWSRWQTPVIVNIAGDTIEEFVELAEYLEGVEGVAGVEINVSCPNVQPGGAVFGSSPQIVVNLPRVGVR